MAFLALDLLAGIIPAWTTGLGAFDALASLSRRLPSSLDLSVSSGFPPGLALLFVVGTPGRHSMGSEEEVEQSVKRADSVAIC
jgi:hypothetical protein